MTGTLSAALVSLIIGLLIGRYFHRKTVDRSVGVYARTDAKLFDGVAEEVREELTVRFRGNAVADLHHLELVVANDGERAVGQFHKPIKIEFPYAISILDATVLDSSHSDLPITLKLDAEDSVARLLLDLPFLNRGDWLVMKVLLTPPVDLTSVSVFTLAEELEPHIRVQSMPAESAGQTWIEKLQWWLLLVALVAVMLGGMVAMNWLAPEVRVLAIDLGGGGLVLGIAAVVMLTMWIALSLLGILVVAKAIDGVGRTLEAIFPVGRLPFPGSYYKAQKAMGQDKRGSDD